MAQLADVAVEEEPLDPLDADQEAAEPQAHAGVFALPEFLKHPLWGAPSAC